MTVEKGEEEEDDEPVIVGAPPPARSDSWGRPEDAWIEAPLTEAPQHPATLQPQAEGDLIDE